MKIVGLERKEFIAENDGAVHAYFVCYCETKPASEFGLQYNSYYVSKSVLDNACKMLSLSNYKNLANRELNITYSYDKEKKTSRITFIGPSVK
jgi:hypothetical protein